MAALVKKRCKEWRKANRYTMRAVAERAGVTRQAINAFENGSGCTGRIVAAYVSLGMPATDIIALIMDGGAGNAKTD